MSIKKYEAFLKTAQLGSLTRAAEALHSTQSRISHILRELEEEFGFSLMQRSRGGIRLTEAGERLMPLMKEILQKQQELETLAADIREAEAGVVRIGVFSSVAVQWLPGMLESFQTTHPKAEVQILSGDYDDLDRWLQSGDVDLSFVTLPAPDGIRGFCGLCRHTWAFPVPQNAIGSCPCLWLHQKYALLQAPFPLGELPAPRPDGQRLCRIYGYTLQAPGCLILPR